jgi:hypothetical protein
MKQEPASANSGVLRDVTENRINESVTLFYSYTLETPKHPLTSQDSGSHY